MPIRIKASAAVVILSSGVLLSGCAQPYATPQQAAANACRVFGSKTMSGALIGGLGGAGSGAAIGALAGGGRGAGIGALVGLGVGLIGGLAVGHSMDQNDCAQAQAALQRIGTAPTGQAINWSNPADNSSGAWIPLTAPEPAGNGQLCRRVRRQVTLSDGRVLDDTAQTCRGTNGDWQTFG